MYRCEICGHSDSGDGCLCEQTRRSQEEANNAISEIPYKLDKVIELLEKILDKLNR